MKKSIVSLFNNESDSIPIWFLRQSGRHIPEYFEIRSRSRNFIDFCTNTDLIVKSTKLPLKYYDLDAAIVFSDILMIPWAMNRNVRFKEDIGPLLDPMIPGNTKIIKNIDINQKLKPLGRAISVLKDDLPDDISLIGFAGAPWTLACYMIEGKGSKDFIKTRTAVWGSSKWFFELIDTLIDYVAQKLEIQANAGADVLMIFDSWSHMIPNQFFENLCIRSTAKIIEILRSKKIKQPIIGFPFKAGTFLTKYSYESQVDGLALDWTVDLKWAIQNLNSCLVFQGNLDPSSLIPNDNRLIYENVIAILETMTNKKFIFNVGHGLTPECKIHNVKNVISIVRKYHQDLNSCYT